MRRDNINYLAVGLFVIVSTSVLLASLYRITGQVGDSDGYYVYLQDVTDLNKGSGVTYQGYRIGNVEDIVPVQENGATRYRIELKVEAGWKIPEHSVARMITTGLLSKAAINILEGKGPGVLEVRPYVGTPPLAGPDLPGHNVRAPVSGAVSLHHLRNPTFQV
jgi:phospholipid/cholesterol/gamma-HCH transport system substrate-binding protein